ncbi:MAG: hypothetical protein IJM30_13040 [Thermoguttaceae bacterium]|nr:hypothetical protein [Thermoguttaceae bacterium]
MDRIQYVAGGNIYPSRFVKQATTAPFTVVQATAGAAVVGISQEGTTVVPIDGFTNASSGFAGTEGLPIKVFGEHSECLLEVAAAVAAGTLLKSDADGKGVAASTGDLVGARALEASTAAGQKIRVAVEIQRAAA